MDPPVSLDDAVRKDADAGIFPKLPFDRFQETLAVERGLESEKIIIQKPLEKSSPFREVDQEFLPGPGDVPEEGDGRKRGRDQGAELLGDEGELVVMDPQDPVSVIFYHPKDMFRKETVDRFIPLEISRTGSDAPRLFVEEGP
jgi:hypothetical protein